MFWTYRWRLNSDEIVRSNMKRLCGFAVSHIVTHYCAAASHRVAWSARRSFCRSASVCHTSEPCKKRLKRSSYHLPSRLGWAQWTTCYMRSRIQMPTWEGAILTGKQANHCELERHSTVICVKMAEPIEVPFGLWAGKHHVLYGRSRSPMGRGNSGG